MKQYGNFDDAKREFIITNPYTPTPWINYLSNGRLCTMISQGGGGMTFLDSAASARLTRYRMGRSIPTDRPGNYIYIKNQDGTIWSPTFEPVRTALDSWECHHGMGYTNFYAEKDGIKIILKYYIHTTKNVLIWDLTIQNKTETSQKVSIFPYIEFSFLDAHEEVFSYHWCRMQSTFTYDEKLGAIKYYYGPPYYEYPRIKVFFSGTETPMTYECDRNKFIGREGTEESPKGVEKGILECSQLHGGGDGCAAFQYDISLQSKEEKNICLYLGVADEWDEADATISELKNIQIAKQEYNNNSMFYEKYLGKYQVELPDKEVESFVNIWNPYNCRHSFERARFVSAVHTGMGGGMQSRDSMQDALSIAHLQPDWVRTRIPIIMKYQYSNGRYIDTFDPRLGKEPEDSGRRSDNGVWSVFTIYNYLAETGDFGLLIEEVNYFDEGSDTIYEHLKKALHYMIENKGKHGLPLMFGQDWNDSLQMFKAEGAQSVMLAQQLVFAFDFMIELSDLMEDSEFKEWCSDNKMRLIKILNSEAVWDGEWYRRIIYADERIPLGSKNRCEAKIYLNTQSWAVISGATSEERKFQCMDNARNLLNTPYGLKLLWPPYTGIPEPPAPLIANLPGVSENAGIFNHANTWAIIAETFLGRGNQAFEYYRQSLPVNIIKTVGADVYMNEPYCYSSHIVAEPDTKAGMGLLSWLSGTTTWMYIAITQYILGVKPTLTGISFDPCIPSSWDNIKIERIIRGKKYHITILNSDHVQKGIKQVIVNGKAITNTCVTYSEEENTYIDIIMG